MAKVKIILKNNRRLSNGSYPVAIRMAYGTRPTVYIRLDGLGVMDENEWSKQLGRFTPKKDNYKELNISLSIIEKKVDSITESLELSNNFSYESFKTIYFGRNLIDNSIANAFNKKIKLLTQLGKHGTAAFYKDSLGSINDFHLGLTFDKIDYKFLSSFEHHRRMRGNSGNTIAVYLRGLRAIHRLHCTENNLNLPTVYSRYKLSSLLTPTRKRALTKTELVSLINYSPSNKNETFAKDIFLFSFLCRGINIMDIAKLTSKNIVNNRIEYTRSKTATLYSIYIIPEIRAIIDKYNDSKKEYLFPIIKDGMLVRHSVKNYTRSLNNTLQNIAKKTILPEDITSYFARHSFAQLSRESGTSIEFISAALGHSDLKTTEIYLKSFENKELDNITTQILSNL